MNLNIYQKLPFIKATQALLTELHLPIKEIADEPLSAQDALGEYHKVNDTFALIKEVYIIGMLDDAAFEGREGAKHTELTQSYDGILFFGVQLHQRANHLLPTRSQLADIARAFNRQYQHTPVVVLYHYADANDQYLAFANTERTAYKQTWREGEKAGKVSLLRDISVSKPHRGHEDIISSLKIPTTGKNKIESFEVLYTYWQKVFSVNVLNKKFYKELSTWYFWAIKHVTFPGEPTRESVLADSGTNDEKVWKERVQEHKAKNVIRLLTRLLFTWFIKEKKLIPDALFDLDSLQDDILKEIAPSQEGDLLVKASNESVYYKAILQNLFFATLNCPIAADGEDKRTRGFRGVSYGTHRGVDYLMRYQKHFKDPEAFLGMMNETVPFLNGGLFECLDDKHVNLYIDGFSDQMTKGENLVVPDYLFFGLEKEEDLSEEYGIKSKETKQAAVKGLINILKSYKFTITENTPIEEDVALDPELLGKVFENLLASYNPETKTTARKQTGSFYTPREIVNYMVDESLIAYLKNELMHEEESYAELGQAQTTLLASEHKKKQLSLETKTGKALYAGTEQQLDEGLHQLFAFDDYNPFTEDAEVTKTIVRALDSCKILDPACGSGAYPMGILQKMVHVLTKLDPQNQAWQNLQITKAQEDSKEAFSIEDKEEREKRLIAINDAFDEKINDADYARKLFLIENCIYGVDIQPVATQISKLRFFISLVVEQKVNADKPNFGIRPLPNLETKFVAANTLIGLEKSTNQVSLESPAIKVLEKELKSVRHKLFGARTKDTKLKYRAEDERLRNAIADELKETGWANDTADKLAGWDPYDQNASSSFFDSKWMFDVKKGFDVVIGNPPYVQLQNLGDISKVLSKQSFLTYSKSGDLYCLFYERGIEFLKNNGTLSYITSNKWMRAGYGKSMRKFFLDKTKITKLIDFGDSPIFENATTYTNILIGSKSSNDKKYQLKVWDLSYAVDEQITLIELLKSNEHYRSQFGENSFLIIKESDLIIKTQVEKIGTPIKDWVVSISYGLKTGFNEAFIISNEEKEELLKKDPRSIELLKPILRGRDIKRYDADYKGYWMIIAHYNSSKLIEKNYPAIYDRLKGYKKELSNRGQCTNRGGKGQHHWLELDNNPTAEYLSRFSKPKIVWAEIVYDSAFYYDDEGTYQEATGFLMTGDNLLYILALLNSKPVTYFFKKFYAGGDLRGNTFRYKKAFIEKLPLPEIKKEKLVSFETLASCVLTLFKMEDKKAVALLIADVIDACVLNLYFPDHMKDLNIDVQEYIEQDIAAAMQDRAWEDLADEQKQEVIHQLHTTWTDPTNEVVKRMSQFKEKSPDILKVIMES
jgi:adenine-specific DNA-methyltransferase